MSFCHCYYNISGISFRQGSYLRLDTMGGILEYRYQFESLTDTCTAFARWFRIIDYNSLLDFNLIIGRQNLSPSGFQTQILAHKNTTSWVAACGDVDDWIKILFTSCAKSCQQMDVSEFDKIGSVSAREKFQKVSCCSYCCKNTEKLFEVLNAFIVWVSYRQAKWCQLQKQRSYAGQVQVKLKLFFAISFWELGHNFHISWSVWIFVPNFTFARFSSFWLHVFQSHEICFVVVIFFKEAHFVFGWEKICHFYFFLFLDFW